VRALIADPNNPDTLYLGTSGGEVYVSTDGAKSWTTPRNGIPFPGHVVDNLALDRNGRLWAAGWGLWGGGVVAMSEDRGKTWTRRDAGLEDVSVRAIAIDPNDSTYVLVGALDGVYRSTDGGETWSKLSPHDNVESLAIDPRTRDRIYVGTRRQGWRSDDGGKIWTHIDNGMVLDTDMFEITIDPEDPDNLWVSTCGWVYNSANRGDQWTRYRDGFNNRRIHDIALDSCERDTVYAGSVAGLYRSDDRGKTWYTVSSEDLVVNSIALHAQRPDRVILGIEGDGIYVSHDRAKSFTRSSGSPRSSPTRRRKTASTRRSHSAVRRRASIVLMTPAGPGAASARRNSPRCFPWRSRRRMTPIRSSWRGRRKAFSTATTRRNGRRHRPPAFRSA
jgi:photosystem II stability/assembly factor-like uncharacterized protein